MIIKKNFKNRKKERRGFTVDKHIAFAVNAGRVEALYDSSGTPRRGQGWITSKMKVWRQTCGEQVVSVKLFGEGEFYNIFLYIFYCHFRLPAKYTQLYWYKRTHNIYLDINSQSRLHKFFDFTHNSAMTNNTWSASLYSIWASLLILNY